MSGSFTYEEAKEACINDGKVMSSVISSASFASIKSNLSGIKAADVWVGLTKDSSGN